MSADAPARDAPGVIILWSHPRSTSTMFERAFLNLPDAFTILHEPMGDAWYFGPERASPRYSPQKCKSDYAHYKDVTFAKHWKTTTTPEDHAVDGKPAPPHIFSKDMAQYLIPPTNAIPDAPPLPDKEDGNPTFIPTKDLLAPHIKHTFLIRTPKLAVPSYYRLCTGDKCSITGFEYFDPEEVGLRESKLLYDFIAAKTGTPPLIIDSADLIAQPEAYMKAFCDHCKVLYSPDMLKWTSGAQEHFAKWPGFHDDAQQSKGIGTHKPDEAKREAEIKAMPDSVHKAIEDNMADYEYLKSKSLQL